MTAVALHPRPTYRTVVQEQLRTVGLALRKEGMFFLVFLGVIGVLGIALALRDAAATPSQLASSHGDEMHDPLSLLLMPIGLAGLLLPFGLAGFLVPFGVWRSDDLSRRSYHWAMPVARGPHTLIKTLSGWLWLMLTVAVYVVFVDGLMGITGRILGESRPDIGVAWRVVTPFTATTIIYLCTSIVVIGSNHPWRWIGGLVALYVIALGCFAATGQHALVHALGAVVTGRYGLLQALGGDLLDLLSKSNVASMRVLPWLKAVTFWMVASGLGVCIAAFRRGNTNAA
ncbi:MAG TPA: hypothetical protein VNU46_06305 [Gemmatimonadaceae bacterium]|jgi:hypothetical protein|nr:hypothetical protein [Gemmatimonadaceae bacterium]